MGVYTEAVQKLYVAYFSRPADAAGLAYWEKVVTDAKGSTAAVSAAFAASQEYKDTFAGQSSYQIIDTIYKNLFGRPAEAAALTFWGQGLLNKNFTIDNAVTAIASGAQGTDLVAYNSKVAAATAFTAALDTSAEMIGYNGTAANNAAKTWLAGITTDAQLKAAIEPAALNGTVIAVTNPPVIGGTFSLTAGVDTIVGTAANDTINALSVNSTTGAPGNTVNAFDAIDGGAGTDTLNIYTTGTENTTLPSSAVVTNVEIVNIYNTAGGSASLANAAAYTGVTQLWQIGATPASVTGLASTTTAGFDGTTGAIGVAGNASATTASIALKGVSEESVVTVTGAKLAGVNLTGTVVDGPTDANTTAGAIAVNATVGKDVTTFSINSAVAATVTVAANGKAVTTVDASASTGAITHVAAAGVTTLRGGAGADALTINTATVAAAEGVTAVSATVEGGAGKDTITVATTGNGATTVDAGAGDDTVAINTRGSGKLTVNLGDGADKFTATAAVAAGDMIDAGAGSDTLALSLVGSANIGAFSNFDLFDAAGLNRTLDVEILAAKNTVTEFVASGTVGAGGATLENVGAGVGVRVTGDMGQNPTTLTVNQKTGGALTVTVDADETGTADNGAELVYASVATNATSVKAVFDTAYLADNAAETAAFAAHTADNHTALTLTATKAGSLEIASGGTNATNHINVTASDELTSITVTGAQHLTIGTVASASELATIDASAATGGLIVSTAAVAGGGIIRLGTGIDVVTVATSSTPAGAERVAGFEKAAAAAVGTNATAAAAAQADADTLVFANGDVADDATVTGGAIKDGVLTFSGAGPTTLADAFSIANAALATELDIVVFEYLGNTYVFQQNGTSDMAVQLVGITGVTEIGEVGTTNAFFLV